MRNFFAILVATFTSFAVFSQTPLPTDQDTIALWNFDADSSALVTDMGPNNIQGTSVNADLLAFPNNAALGNSRFFKDQTSFISFGTLTPNDPLDLLSLNSWTIEFVTSYNRRPNEYRNIFDNGQVSVQVIDQKFAVTINRDGTRFGLMTENMTAINTSYRVAVVFENNKLSIVVNGKTEASTDLNYKKSAKKSRIYDLPIRVGGTPLEGVSDFALGRNHACLKTDLGEVKCWGNNDSGQLGDRTKNFYFMPIKAEGISDIDILSLGDLFTCGSKLGKVYCWGNNNFLTLGSAIGPNSFTAIEVPGLTNVQDVKSGRSHSCALLNDNKVKCWGRNELGQLGAGFINTASFLTESSITDVDQIAVGGEHTCALKEDGTVWCWGDNSKGQIGQIPSQFPVSSLPLEVPITDVKKIAAGTSHTCAQKNNNSIYCWGSNQFGQLGIGSTTDASEPMLVSGINGTATDLILNNSDHTCVLLGNPQVSCWGRNDRSQLGLATSTAFSSVPVLFPYDYGITNLKISGRTNCYQRNDKTLHCFGSNSFGLLGNGSIFASSMFPALVLATKQSNFPGFIDDIRISDVARYPIIKPTLAFVEPFETLELNPEILISTASTIAIDPASLQVTLNNVSVTGLYFESGDIKGVLNAPLIYGANVLEVKIKDTNGNLASLRSVINYNQVPAYLLPVQVETKGNTSCYLTGEGAVWCWGSNQTGQLGSESILYSSNPIKNPYLSNIIKIYVASTTICAKDRELNYWCWGNNTNGQVGTSGNYRKISIPQKVIFPKTVDKLIAGDNNFCAIYTDKTVGCWGQNNFMLGGLGDKRVPTAVNNFDGVVSGTLGKNHSCFLKENGSAWCMGTNNVGQLGDALGGRNYPSEIYGGLRFQSISGGYDSTCAIELNGTTHCWGQNLYKQLGLGPNSQSSYYWAQQVTAFSTPVSFSSGEQFGCGLYTNGNVGCFGQNTHGEIGNGLIEKLNHFHLNTSLQFQSISSGKNTTCGLTLNQKVYCWGSNNIGQAGNSLGTTTLSPIEVVPHVMTQKSLTDLVVGQANSCMKINQETFCWGNNEQGQLGFENGNFVETYPTKVIGNENATQTSIGYGLICHVTPASLVSCAGFNNYRQAGQDSYIYQKVSPAMIVPGLTNVKQVEAGLDHSCALKYDGTVWCWGSNYRGQLGLGGGTSGIHPPTQTISLSDVAKIGVAERGQHTCALKNDGTVWCWGRNDLYQTGLPKSYSEFIPKQVTSVGNDNKDITVGGFFTCTHKTDDKAICFGYSAQGQLGNGILIYNFNFERMPFPTKIKKIQAGYEHACALDINNDVYCWGGNEEGQVGIGIFEDTPYATKITSKVEELAVGAEHVCVLNQSNKLACWGFNGNAQFGNGTTDSRPVPTFSDIKKL